MSVCLSKMLNWNWKYVLVYYIRRQSIVIILDPYSLLGLSNYLSKFSQPAAVCKSLLTFDKNQWCNSQYNL